LGQWCQFGTRQKKKFQFGTQVILSASIMYIFIDAVKVINVDEWTGWHKYLTRGMALIIDVVFSK